MTITKLQERIAALLDSVGNALTIAEWHINSELNTERELQYAVFDVQLDVGTKDNGMRIPLMFEYRKDNGLKLIYSAYAKHVEANVENVRKSIGFQATFE